MYLLIQHGARLDSEFFPESLVRRTWPSAIAVLPVPPHARVVDRVIVYYHYDLRLRKNEEKLLRLLSSSDHDACRRRRDGRHSRLVHRVECTPITR